MKKRNLPLCALVLLLLMSGCTKERQEEQEQPPVKDLTTDVTGMKSLSAFKTENLNVFLEFSDKLPVYGQDGYAFQPAKLNQKGYLFGIAEAKDHTGDIRVLYTDINRQNATGNDYQLVSTMKRTNDKASVVMLDVSDEYAVYYDSGAGILWLYDIQKNINQKIDQLPAKLQQPPFAHIDQQVISFSFKDKDHSTCKQYDITKAALTVLPGEQASSPVTKDGQLYFIEQDQKKETISVYRQNGKEKKELLTKSSMEGTFDQLLIDDAYVYLPYQMKDSTILYRYDQKRDAIEPYFKSETLQFNQLAAPYLSWSGLNDQHGLLDMEQNIRYTYPDGAVFMSERGYVWVEYISDAKGKIDPMNTQLWFAPQKQ